jgi:hypothetical protein
MLRVAAREMAGLEAPVVNIGIHGYVDHGRLSRGHTLSLESRERQNKNEEEVLATKSQRGKKFRKKPFRLLLWRPCSVSGVRIRLIFLGFLFWSWHISISHYYTRHGGTEKTLEF